MNSVTQERIIFQCFPSDIPQRKINQVQNITYSKSKRPNQARKTTKTEPSTGMHSHVHGPIAPRGAETQMMVGAWVRCGVLCLQWGNPIGELVRWWRKCLPLLSLSRSVDMTIQFATATCKLSCWDEAIETYSYTVQSGQCSPALLYCWKMETWVLCDFCTCSFRFTGSFYYT